MKRTAVNCPPLDPPSWQAPMMQTNIAVVFADGTERRYLDMVRFSIDGGVLSIIHGDDIRDFRPEEWQGIRNLIGE